MENNEKYIIKNLKHHSEEIDLDGLWDEVSLHIPKEKKQRRFGFWIIGGVIIGLLSLGLYWMNTQEPNHDDIHQSLISVSSDEKSNTEFDKAELVSNKLKLEKNSEVKEVQDPIEEYSSNPTQTLAQQPSIINQEKSVGLPNVIQENPSDQNSYENINDDNSNLKSNSSSNATELYSSIPNTISRVNEQKNKEIENENPSVEKRSIKSPLLHIPFLTNQNQQPLSHKRDMASINSNVGIHIQKQSNILINRWSFYINGGGGYANRNLSTSTIELQPEANRRNTIVDVLGSWKVDGGLEFRVMPKWRLSLGLGYLQIHEKATFETDYLIPIDVEKEHTVYYQDGSVENNLEQGNGEGIRHTEEIRFNQLKMLRIPVRISYQLLNWNSSKIHLGASAAYTIRQNYDGFTSLSPSQERYDLDLDLDNRFRTNGSMSYGIFMEGTTHLTSAVDLTFSLGYQKIKNINTELYLIDQEYNSLSLTSGLRHRF